MKKTTQQDATKPLLLTFTQGHVSRLDRAMLKEMADHFGWTETQTIHVALTRMFVITFPQYVDDGPTPKRKLVRTTNLQSSEFESLSDWATAAKARLKTKAKSAKSTKKTLPAAKKIKKPLKVVAKVAKKVPTKTRDRRG